MEMLEQDNECLVRCLEEMYSRWMAGKPLFENPPSRSTGRPLVNKMLVSLGLSKVGDRSLVEVETCESDPEHVRADCSEASVTPTTRATSLGSKFSQSQLGYNSSCNTFALAQPLPIQECFNSHTSLLHHEESHGMQKQWFCTSATQSMSKKRSSVRQNAPIKHDSRVFSPACHFQDMDNVTRLNSVTPQPQRAPNMTESTMMQISWDCVTSNPTFEPGQSFEDSGVTWDASVLCMGFDYEFV